MRIVFMGTPEFAVSTLDALVKANYNVVAVVTSPDKPAGRGLTMKSSEVKQYALAHNLPVLQPEKLKDPAFVNALQDLKPDLIFVVAFRMLPEVIWTMPPMGTINIHASILPQYRGAAPINWAIINGEKETGVTSFFIEKEIDTGKIIARKHVTIERDETAGTLHDKLAQEGSILAVETVKLIESGNFTPLPQAQFTDNNNQLKAAPKIFRNDCRINWLLSTQEIYNFIRGLSPYPGAWTTAVTHDGVKTLKILKCKHIQESKHHIKQLWWDKNTLYIGTSDGCLAVEELQLEGKRAMKADEFIRGMRDLDTLRIE